MDRRISCAVCAALASLSLLGCGGGGGNATATASGSSASAASVQGVATPRAVSVVTAKNAN